MRALGGSLLLTLRELWALRITQGLLVVATLAWVVLSLALNLDIVEGSLAAMRIFGIESIPTQGMRDPATGDYIQTAVSVDSFVLGINQFVFGAAYFLGTLLGLFAAMPLIGGFLEPGRLDLLLSKPLSRNRLLAGHVAGVWLTVLVLSTYLIGSVWLTVSVKTGFWEPRFLLSIPVIVVMFGVMYSVILSLSIMTRNTGLGLVGAYGLVFVSVIFAAHEQILLALTGIGRSVFLILYHILPNFAEVVVLVAQLASGDAVPDLYPLASSLLFGVVIYAISFGWFSRKDF